MFLYLVVGLWVTGVAASGEDFTNNLFSDLAPLLALFGENFAQQFLSESFTWLDFIIFAMAPLGIITAIVGAIRVGGPTWLKAVIGRARETRASAEVELMSSTSHEVCELWNGEAIVRTMGEPIVQQIVYLEGCEDEFGLYTCSIAEGEKLENHNHEGPFFKAFRPIKKQIAHIMKRFIPRKQKNTLANHSKDDLITIENGDVADIFASSKGAAGPAPMSQNRAPNISVNLPVHRHSLATIDKFLVAIAGILLQTGVLVFSAYTAYSPSLGKKVGGRPSAYAFPLLASGTILLVIGMIICSAVIDSSTTEVIWERINSKEVGGINSSKPKRNRMGLYWPWRTKDTKKKLRVFWLQRKHVVGDTSFDSFLIMARGNRTRILNSRRGDEIIAPREKRASSNSSYEDDDDKEERKTVKSNFGTVLEYLTVIGVFTGLAGFVLQFEGFRGTSWSCSIAQLVAILIMTILRAYVRRGLLKKPYTKAVPFEHEMDWLALKIGFNTDFFDCDGDLESKGEDDSASQRMRRSSGASLQMPPPPYSKWDVVCHPTGPAIFGVLSSPLVEVKNKTSEQDGNPQSQVDETKSSGDAPTPKGEKNNPSTDAVEAILISDELSASQYAERVVGIRRRLGQLTNWASPASELAISIAKSVEIVMNKFFGDSQMTLFTWSLEVQIAPKKGRNSGISWIPSTLSFTAKKDPKKGWKTDSTYIESVLSLWLYRTNKIIKTRTSQINRKEKNADWLRSTKAGVTGSFYRVLGPDTKTLRNDISWWIGDYAKLAIANQIRLQPDKFNLVVGFVGFGAEKYNLDIEHEEFPNSRHPSISKLHQSKSNVSMPQPTQPRNERDGQFKPFDGFLCLSSTAETEEFLAQHIFSSFMWAVSKEIPKQKLGASEVDIHAAEQFNLIDHDWNVVKLVNKTIQDIARDIEATGLGTIEEIYLVLIPPLSVASKLPNEAIVEMIRRKAKDLELRHQWREVASAYAKLLELYQECDAKDQFTYKGVAAIIDFLVTTTSIPTPDDDDSDSDDEEISFSEAKDLLCDKLTKGSLGQVSAQIRELYVNQCRERAYDKAMGWPWEGEKGDAKLSKAADVLLFGYTQLHKEIVGGKEDFNGVKTEESWYSSDILGWTPFHYGIHRYGDKFQIKKEEVNIDRVSRMRDSTNRTLLDHTLMRGLGVEMVNTFVGIYPASSLEPGRDGFLSLHWAAMNGYDETLASLLKHTTLPKDQKERLAFKGDFWGRTPLHLASNQGQLNAVKELLKWAEQASLGNRLAMETDNRGRTALHLAAFIGREDVVAELLASQPWERIKAPDKFGYNALHIAIERLHDKVVEIIVVSLEKDKEGDKEYIIGKQQYWKVLDLETHAEESSYDEKETALDIARRLEDEVEEEMNQWKQEDNKKTEAQDLATNQGETAEGLQRGDVPADIQPEDSKSAKNKADKKEELENRMKRIKNIFSSLFKGEKEDSEESARRLLWTVKVESKTGFDVLFSKGVKDFVQDKDDRRTILHIEAERGNTDRINILLDSWKNRITDQDPKLKVPTNAPRKPSLVDRSIRDPPVKENVKTPQSTQETLVHAINLLDEDEETALSLAVVNNHENVVTILLGAGADLGVKTKGSNALHLAIDENSSIFSLLLAKAAEKDINALNDSGNTPLMEAIDQEAWDCAIALLEIDTSKFKLLLEERYHSDERTALGLASWKGEEEVVRLLLKKGASKKATDDSGDTPLHEACWKGHLPVASRLIDAETLPISAEDKNGETGVESEGKVPNAKPKDEMSGEEPKMKAPDIDARNKYGRTPLFYATMKGRDAVVEMLLTKGANPDEKDDDDESILMCAAKLGEESTFMHILKWVKNINVADELKRTPLLWLIRQKMENALSALLLKDDIDVKTHPDNFLPPLHEATRRCSLPVVQLLLGKIDTALAKDSQGRTALHIAAAHGRLEIVKSFLDIKDRKPLLDELYDDKQGKNVLHHAACSGDLEIIEFLLHEQGGAAMINKPDNNGWTPLHWATKSGIKEVFTWLLGYGADPNLKETLNDETPIQLLHRYGHKALAQELPSLALQYGKPIDEDLKKRRVGHEWTGVSCDGCYCEPIRGARFECQDCLGIWNGFDLCEKCEKSTAETHPGHTFNKKEEEDESEGEDEDTDEEREREAGRERIFGRRWA